jgi:hypothetical protein
MNCALAVLNKRTAFDASNGVTFVGLSNLLLIDLNSQTYYNLNMFKTTDLAYAAGYIDGDGCFFIDKIFAENRFKYRYSIIINSTEIENLQWFQKTFGGVLTSKPSIKEGHKPLHRYVIKGKYLDTVKDIEKFLVEKYEEFKIFEKFRNPLYKEQRNDLIVQMRFLKKHSNLIPISIKQDLEIYKNSVIPSIEDFAYLAGFIDAECCLNLSKSHPKGNPNPVYKIILTCNNTKSPCFKWLVERFGGFLQFIDRSKYANNRNQMMWRLSANSLLQILPSIIIFLKHKKPVCEKLIEFSKTILPLKGTISRNNPNFRAFYKPILDKREKIFHEIQHLNKKGI